MAFPLLGLAAGAATGAALKYGPHIFRYLYPRVAPKMVTGGKRLGQLMKQGLKNPVVIGGAIGSGLDNNILDIIINEAHAPTGPKLPTLPPLQTPPDITPRTEIPFGVGNHAPLPNAQELDGQALTPMAEVASRPEAQPSPNAIQPSPVDTRSSFEKFVQSEAYQKLQDLFAGMAAGPSGGSGWDALASGVKHLNKGDKERQQINQTVEYLKSQGMSEEEARFIAGNKAALNAFWGQKLSGGSNNPQFTSDGRMLVKDPDAPGGYRYLITEGSKASDEMKNREQMNKVHMAHTKTLIDDIDRVQAYINKFNNLSTGLGVTLASYISPTSQQSDVRQMVDSIKSRISLDRMDTMKQMSQDGRLGVGALSDKDMDLFKQSLGAISLNMSAQELSRRLTIIKDFLLKLNDKQYNFLFGENKGGINNAGAQGNVANLPTVSGIEEANRMPIGSTVIYNGQVYKRDQ